ncbi:MAG: VWA domain-containing protein [Promethearchaeota archaeon]
MSSYDDFFVPRILLMSDGEADSRTAWQAPLEEAIKQGIVIDVVALLSKKEDGRKTLETIASKAKGEFIIPEDLEKFIRDFVRLSKKKHAQKVEDIVLCLDVSGSMSEKYRASSKSKINALKDAVLKFSAEKLSIDPRDRVAVVVFGSNSGEKVEVLIQPSPYDKALLEKTVSGLRAQNGTPLAKGLSLSIKTLDVPAKRSNFKVNLVESISDYSQMHGVPGSCKYCEATGKPTPGIDANNWYFFEGIRGVNVFKCPICGALYHGMCFDKHVTRGGNAGVCYGCNSVVGVGDNLSFQTPSPAEGGLLLCPACNEPLPANARFCGHCGLKLTDAQRAGSGASAANFNAPGMASQAPKSLFRQESFQSASHVPQHAIFNPNDDQLKTCPKCGYACQPTWTVCPICNTPLK